MQPPSERIPLTFFVPGEAYLVLEHDRSLQGQALIERLRQHPLVLSDERLASAIDQVRPADVVTITGPNDTLAGGCNWIVGWLIGALGLGSSNRSQAANNNEFLEQPRITSMVFTRVSQFTDFESQQAFIVDFIGILNTRAKELQQDGDTLIVQAVAPNWLNSGAPGQFGMGGPGAKPVPAYPSQQSRPWTFSMPTGFAGNMRNQGKPVEVAILDSVPDNRTLSQAFSKFADHELLQQVRQQTTGGLNIIRPITEGTDYAWLNHPVLGIAMRDHFYPMSDHGLFIAGIIVSIAPQAKIRVIEVLSHWGIGTMQTIANGLNQLLSQRNPHVPLVINLSLTIEIPTEEYLPPNWREDSRLREWEWFFEWLKDADNKASVEASFAALQTLCSQLEATGAVIVAAAGNNGHNGQHPPARYPAAFNSVTGVGALKYDGHAAEYSNEADRLALSGNQPLAGIVTFGGDVDMSTNTANTQTGMLGVYIGSFPDDRTNENGWAHWAGTSFAAPVIAGTVARLIAAGDSPQDALSRIRSAQIDVDKQLGDGEIFAAVQNL